MGDFLNKVIAVILTFVFIFGGGMLITTLALDLRTTFAVHNEVKNFIDKVEDVGVITDKDLQNLYVNTSINGLITNVNVKREVLTLYPTDANSGNTTVVYVESNQIDKFNQGDRILVTVEAVDYSTAQRLAWMLLNLYTDKMKFGLAGVVEQNG